MNTSLIHISWSTLLILVVVIYLMTKECPPNCTKNWMAGCECHGPGGAVVHTGIHIG